MDLLSLDSSNASTDSERYGKDGNIRRIANEIPALLPHMLMIVWIVTGSAVPAGSAADYGTVTAKMSAN